MLKEWLRKRQLKKAFKGDYDFNVDLSKSLPKTAQDWHCYVCGDYIGTSKETLFICEKKSCARKMGIVETYWEETE